MITLQNYPRLKSEEPSDPNEFRKDVALRFKQKIDKVAEALQERISLSLLEAEIKKDLADPETYPDEEPRHLTEGERDTIKRFLAEYNPGLPEAKIDESLDRVWIGNFPDGINLAGSSIPTGGAVFEADGRTGPLYLVGLTNYRSDFSEAEEEQGAVTGIPSSFGSDAAAPFVPAGFEPPSKFETYKHELIHVFQAEGLMPFGGFEDSKTINGVDHVNDYRYGAELSAGADPLELLSEDHAEYFSTKDSFPDEWLFGEEADRG